MSSARYSVQAPTNSKTQKACDLERQFFSHAAQPRSETLELPFRIGKTQTLPCQFSACPKTPLTSSHNLVLLNDRLPNSIVSLLRDSMFEFPDGARLS